MPANPWARLRGKDYESMGGLVWYAEDDEGEIHWPDFTQLAATGGYRAACGPDPQTP